jgi:hypothetical protein
MFFIMTDPYINITETIRPQESNIQLVGTIKYAHLQIRVHKYIVCFPQKISGKD